MRLDYIDNIDCLEGLKEIPDKSVDLVVTDPPYGIGIKSQGGSSSKLDPWADMCNASLWYSAWLRECKRIIKDDGAVWSFINWRYFTTLQKAGLDIAWSIETLLIWDKGLLGPAGPKALRTSYEQVALFAGPDFKIKNRSLPDIQKFQWRTVKPTGHPAEKPLDLIRWLIQTSGKQGGVILDPFMGSGTTACAAVLEGSHFIGFEMDANWKEKADARVAETVPPEPDPDEDWMS